MGGISYFPTLALSGGLFTLMYMASNNLLLSMCSSLSMTLTDKEDNSGGLCLLSEICCQIADWSVFLCSSKRSLREP